MTDQLPKPKRAWGLVVFGILSIIAGICVSTQPFTGLLWLSFFAGAVFFVDGIFQVFDYIKNRQVMGYTVATLIFAILSVILGGLIIAHPLSGIGAIVMVASFAFIASGVFSIIGAFGLKGSGAPGWGWLVAGGILDVIVGFAVFGNPGLLALFMGLSLAMHGIMYVAVGLQKH